MSRVFLHFEGEPAFTLKVTLGSQELSTVAQVIEVRFFEIVNHLAFSPN